MPDASRLQRYAVIAGFAAQTLLCGGLVHRLLVANEHAEALERALQRSRGDTLFQRAAVLRLEGKASEALALVRAAAAGALGSEVATEAAYHVHEALVIPSVALVIPESHIATELDFDAAGLHVVARDARNTERAWNAETGRLLPNGVASPLRPSTRPLDRQRTVERPDVGRVLAQGSRVVLHPPHGPSRAFDVSPAEIRAVELTSSGDALWLGDQEGRIGRMPLDGSEPTWRQALNSPVVFVALLSTGSAPTPVLVVMGEDGSMRTWHEADVVTATAPGLELPALPEVAQFLFVRRSGALVAVTRTVGVHVLEAAACGTYRNSCFDQSWRRLPLALPPAVRLAAFSPDTDRLAVLSGGALVLTDLDYGQALAPGPRGGANAAFAQDASGSVLAMASMGELVIVDARVDPPRRVVHAIPNASPDVEVSEDGSLVVLFDGSERLLAVRTSELDTGIRWTLPRAPRHIELTRRGEELVYRASEGGFYRWDTGAQVERSFALAGSADPPAHGLVLAQSDHILVWDAQRAALCPVGTATCTALAPLPDGDIEHASASDDGTHIFTLHAGGAIAVFDARGALATTLDDEGAIERAVMAALGGSLFLLGADGSSRLLTLPSGRRLASWPAGPALFDGPPGATQLFTGDGAFWLSVMSTSGFSVEGLDALTGSPLPEGSRVPTAHLGRSLPVQAAPFPGRPAIVAFDGGHASVIEVLPSGHRREWLRVPASRAYVTADGDGIVTVGEWVRRIDVHADPSEIVRATAALTNYRVCEACMEPVVVPPEQLSDPVWAPSALCSCP